jgi:CheY-like chemotaxis protein
MATFKRPPPVVLIVEDETLVRTDAVEALCAAGYAVLEATSADAAIEILHQRDDIRVVYTDVHMPGSMDGVRLAHHIAKKWPRSAARDIGAGQCPQRGPARGGAFLP